MARRSEVGPDLFYDFVETPMGWVGALSSGRGLRRTTLPKPSPDVAGLLSGHEESGAEHSPDQLADVRANLEGYFRGEQVDFGDVALDFHDTSPFLQAAWTACRAIPRGETRTYKWLAARTGRPNAPRATGQSMARNRFPIVVPCHRVIASDGGLGGFGDRAAQLDLKRRLLELEGAFVAQLL